MDTVVILPKPLLLYIPQKYYYNFPTEPNKGQNNDLAIAANAGSMGAAA